MGAAKRRALARGCTAGAKLRTGPVSIDTGRSSTECVVADRLLWPLEARVDRIGSTAPLGVDGRCVLRCVAFREGRLLAVFLVAVAEEIEVLLKRRACD